MKHPQLKLRKKVIKVGVKRFKGLVKDVVHDCLMDIEWYLVEDIIKLLKKEGIIYVQKASKKNKKKNKRAKK